MIATDSKIYKLNTGHFQVSFTNPVTGKRNRNKFHSEREAKMRTEEIARKYFANDRAHFNNVLVAHLIERHLQALPRTRFIERKNSFLSFYDEFANTRLSYLNRTALLQWFEKIRAKHNYSERTLSAIRSQIKCFFQYLLDENIIVQSPLDKIRFRRHVPPRRPRVVLAVDEVNEILRNAKTFSPNILFPFLSCIAHTGARRKEVILLNREDVDFKTGMIHLKKTKNGHERWINMSPTVEKVMRDHLASHPYQEVFVSEGKRLDRHAGLARVMDKFKVYFPMDKHNWGCHSLRHSFAYNFLKKGGNMYQLQAVLGHRSIDVTIDLYGQLQAQDVSCPSPYEPEQGANLCRIFP